MFSSNTLKWHRETPRKCQEWTEEGTNLKTQQGGAAEKKASKAEGMSFSGVQEEVQKPESSVLAERTLTFPVPHLPHHGRSC